MELTFWHCSFNFSQGSEKSIAVQIPIVTQNFQFFSEQILGERTASKGSAPPLWMKASIKIKILLRKSELVAYFFNGVDGYHGNRKDFQISPVLQKHQVDFS